MRTYEKFQKFLLKNRIVLLPSQREAAECILSNERTVRFLAGGYGSGKTFLLSILEEFGRSGHEDVGQ